MVRKLTPNSKYRQRYNQVMTIILVMTLLSFTELRQQQRIVVCFGDSITYGARVDRQSWVWYLQKEETGPFKFINAGRSGRRTSDRSELLPVLQAHPNPAVFVFFLGVNDLKNGNDPMVDTALENMKWMIHQVKAVAPKAKILLLAPSDINTVDMSQVNKDKLYNEHTRSSLVHLAKGYSLLAQQEHIDFLSLLPVVSKDAYADGLHPNPKGQQQLKSAIWKKIKSYAN